MFLQLSRDLSSDFLPLLSEWVTDVLSENFALIYEKAPKSELKPAITRLVLFDVLKTNEKDFAEDVTRLSKRNGLRVKKHRSLPFLVIFSPFFLLLILFLLHQFLVLVWHQGVVLVRHAGEGGGGL